MDWGLPLTVVFYTSEASGLEWLCRQCCSFSTCSVNYQNQLRVLPDHEVSRLNKAEAEPEPHAAAEVVEEGDKVEGEEVCGGHLHVLGEG